LHSRPAFADSRNLESLMSTTTIIIVIVVLLVLFGGWGWTRRGRV
jgi:hypothetical protein